MRFKWKGYFRFIVTCLVIFILLYVLRYRMTFELNLTYLTKNHRELFQEKVKFTRLNVPILQNTNHTYTLDKTFFNVTSTCKGILFPYHRARKESWRATNGNKQSYVFAAYLAETEPEVVIIGIQGGGSSQYYCQLWTRNFGNQTVKMEEKPARVTTLSEGHGLRYTAVLFYCKLSPSPELPTYISMVTESCSTPLNLLEIQILRKAKAKHRFTVCLSPLNFKYNRDYELIEWMELNRILGAEKFIVYNYSSAYNVAHVLEYYSKRGLTEVVQWDLPVGVNTWPRENKPVEIHYFGQVAALHDCLFRNKRVSEFIVNLDLDEFVIPHGENVTNWSEMLTQLKHDSKVYLFRNTFFKKEWENTDIKIQNESLVNKLKLVTLQKLQHETKISAPSQRSKYFAKTDYVSRVMIHDVPGVSIMRAPTEIGLLHHYRDWETRGDPESVKVLDETVPRKFGQHLIKNVQQVWSDLNTDIYAKGVV